MLFSLFEIFNIFVMSFALGFIFTGIAKRPKTNLENYYRSLTKKSFRINTFIKDLLYSTAVIAPGIVLHEMGHKFTAILFGAHATFYASYEFLGLGIILKLVNFPFLFFIPGYVSIIGSLTALQSALIAFDGPFMNLIVSMVSLLLFKKLNKINQKWKKALYLSYKINLFLFFFNLIPIPPFDGYTVLTGLIRAF